MERELAELRDRLRDVDAITARRAEIEAELNEVWTEQGTRLEEPAYVSSSVPS